MNLLNSMTDINSKNSKKIAIFGGSFDPVHNAHVELIKNLSERFDKVIVVPSYESPFKIGVKKASPEDRLTMLRLAVSGLDKVIVSDYEILKKGISYSVETAEHFLSYGNLFWIIGSEMLNRLTDWKDFDVLKGLVTFYVVKRPGFEITIPDFIANSGIKLEIADFDGADVSSSKIKIDVAFGFETSDLPKNVYDYIVSRKLYTDYKYIVDGYEKFGLTYSRQLHSYNVALTAVNLAKRYNVDVDKTIIAALLHDIAKYIGEERETELGLKCDEPLKECRHAELGAQIAEKYFGIKDKEILDAIKYHTVCNKDMDNLAKIIALADYIEPGRNFSGVEKIRRIAEKDLDESVISMLENTLEYLKGKIINKNSIEALNYFKLKKGDKF